MLIDNIIQTWLNHSNSWAWGTLFSAPHGDRWHWFSCYAFWRLYGQLGWNCEYELTKYHRYFLRLEVYIHIFEIIHNICIYFHICMWCIHINMICIYIIHIVAMLQNSDMPKPLNSSVIPVLSFWSWYWELPGTNLQKDIPSFPPLKQMAELGQGYTQAAPPVVDIVRELIAKKKVPCVNESVKGKELYIFPSFRLFERWCLKPFIRGTFLRRSVRNSWVNFCLKRGSWVDFSGWQCLFPAWK